MSPIRNALNTPRMLGLIGTGAMGILVFSHADSFSLGLRWFAAASTALLLCWLLVRRWQRRRTQGAERVLDTLVAQPEKTLRSDRGAAAGVEHETLRRRMRDAVRTIKKSRLGHGGQAALYQLPWYITIGNPAAGKSSAIINSGLKFPFEDGAGSAVQGVGGTRNCDWFFTTEGILLDTAGRYAIHADEDRQEWLFFLAQLRKLRPLAPINGIIITASIAELTAGPPEFSISLARNLRQRVQELTENLGVFAPAYVMFTKADLVAGFSAFFADVDWNERDRAWGATLPCDTASRSDALALFDRHFDELHDGLRELSVAQMARMQGGAVAPELLSFPLEFAALKPALRVFIATLFEGNPFQFEPVFRGFYFTSAMQNGEACGTTNHRVETRFALDGDDPVPIQAVTERGLFLRDLFSKVIFADRHLVRQYARRGSIRMRRFAALAAVAMLGAMLGGWSWSHANNRALVEEVRADLEHVIRLQQDRGDLQSHLAALEVLQDRILHLERLETERPLALGLGLYQGGALKARLTDEYFSGIRAILLDPVGEQLEAFLAAVNTHDITPVAGVGRSLSASATGAPVPYVAANPAQVEDAYNALKTYLMLATGDYLDQAHLSDQLTRMWRGWLEANRAAMPRADMIKHAERILSFHIAQAGNPQWPLLTYNPALVEQTRAKLGKVVHGAPALERVYADLKARAATRYAPVTVATLAGPDSDRLIAGSAVVSGAFTRDAWHGHVRQTIREAANGERQTTDWVLKHATRDDLTLHGSPEQIEQSLTAMYQEEYVREWQRFLQGVVINAFDGFPQAVAAMEHLGDPQRSPLGKVLRAVDAHTDWARAEGKDASLAHDQTGLTGWLRHTVLRMAPTTTGPTVPAASPFAPPAAEVSAEFAGISRLLAARDDGPPLVERYLQHLAAIRTRLNLIAHEGDPGPGALKLMQATMEGTGSELADTLRFVDEQMLAGLAETQRNMLRPLLVRPLLQIFAAIVQPAEHELNRIWQAQVHEPFNLRLAVKYPFAPDADIEATPVEIARIFGPEGAIANYVDRALGALVVRRGQAIAPRTWGELGLRLKAEFIAGLPRWVGPLEGAAAPARADDAPQTTFMLMPLPSPGTRTYMIEIDGQRLHYDYDHGRAQWATFVWPNPGATAGARILANRDGGEAVEIAHFAGRFGLEKLINSAERRRNPDGSFVLAWGNDKLPVRVGLRIISSSQAQAASAQTPRNAIGGSLPSTITGAPPAKPGNSVPPARLAAVQR